MVFQFAKKLSRFHNRAVSLYDDGLPAPLPPGPGAFGFGGIEDEVQLGLGPNAEERTRIPHNGGPLPRETPGGTALPKEGYRHVTCAPGSS